MGELLSTLQITQHVGVMAQNYYMAELDALKASATLCPEWIAPAQEGKFVEPEDRGAVVAKRVRNPKGMPPKVGVTFKNGVSYACEHRAAITDISREELKVGSAFSVDLIQHNVANGISELMEGWEAEVIARYRGLNPETWAYDAAIAATYFANVGDQVKVIGGGADKWDHKDGQPLKDIATGLTFLEKRRPANYSIWIPYNVGYGLMNNTQWVSRYGTGVPFHEASGHVPNILGTPVVWYRGKANLGGTSLKNYMGNDVFIAPTPEMGPNFDGHVFRAHWADGDAAIDPPRADDLQTATSDNGLTVWVYSDPEPEVRTVRVSFSLGMWSEPTIAKDGGSDCVYLMRDVLT